MSQYCLDSNVFIQAEMGPYGMDIVPAFWDFLDKKTDEGIIYSSIMVYNELKIGTSELSKWVKNRKDNGLFVNPSESVQNKYTEIANYTYTNYRQEQAEIFLEGADPWIIAHSKSNNSTVVTHESLVGPESKKVKIPNICNQFDVKYINSYDMLRTLNARFTLSQK